MFVAALLAAWEIVGVNLKRSSDGNTEAKLPSMDVALELATPDATVWILVLALFYFAMRFGFVWAQQDIVVRSSAPAMIEYRVTHLLALLAFFVWIAARFIPEFRLGTSAYYACRNSLSLGSPTYLT